MCGLGARARNVLNDPTLLRAQAQNTSRRLYPHAQCEPSDTGGWYPLFRSDLSVSMDCFKNEAPKQLSLEKDTDSFVLLVSEQTLLPLSSWSAPR
jgi:hypothetical protein